MKKNYILFFLAVLLTGLMFFSCKSTPKTEEPAVEEVDEDAVSQELLDALSAAKAKADAARKRASDFEAQLYFPSDWEAAEGSYSEAGALPSDIEESVIKATELYIEAAALYDDLFAKTVPLLAQAIEDEIVAARNELIATGLTKDFPEYLEGADNTTLEALAQYENNDYYAARETAAAALAKYQILLSAANAFLLREEIIEYDFVSRDEENFNKADEAGTAAMEAYDAGQLKVARDGIDEAQLRYNLVLNTGWETLVAEREETATAERQTALDNKANVAVRDDFSAANALLQKAAASLAEKKFRDAAIQYTDAGIQFANASAEAVKKRIIAEEAIREAEERLEASDEAARQAELIIEGE